MTPPTLTLFFIVEPPQYQYMACYLAASIRQHLPAEVELVGYCPQHRLGDLDPAVTETLRRMRCELRPMQTEGRFDPAYPHGNKILACLEPRTTDFSGFMDSDILMIRDNRIENLVRPGHVSASVAASMYWAPQTIWDPIYAAFGMPVTQQRVMLMRDKRKPMIPYYSSGFVVFPEQYRTPDGQSFAQVWMQTAQTIEQIEGLDNKRPYLDQMSLPLAIQRAGLDWNELPEEQHFILGGQLRGQPFPHERGIFTVHYRKWDVLAENGLAEQGYDALRDQVGTRRVSWVPKQPLPAGIAPLPDQDQARHQAPAPTQPPAKPTGPDPSKGNIAAVTMVHEDHFFLERWVRYYAAQIGRENLYVLRHGADPDIDRIAAGTNIIHLPNPEDKSGFDGRRWTALSKFASGLTLYYNWVLCNDVDEVLAVDPAVSDSLSDYLNAKFKEGRAPHAISPFAVEIVHTPATEKAPITQDAPILSVRRNFRLNSNYAKPCVIRGRIGFSVGGHGSNLRRVPLDPHLYLFHLRYVDHELSRQRLEKRRKWMELKNGPVAQTGRKKATWDQGDEVFNSLSQLEPVATTMEFPDFRKAMIEGRTQAASTGNWFFRNMRSKELYHLPERFTTLF
ncbi:MAG: glycosyltransferase family 2 protein [Rhodobacteraceae bacterium]|nr:glycosyltransferase family 2 protein [Paracoccaceae bacterium]